MSLYIEQGQTQSTMGKGTIIDFGKTSKTPKIELVTTQALGQGNNAKCFPTWIGGEEPCGPDKSEACRPDYTEEEKKCHPLCNPPDNDCNPSCSPGSCQPVCRPACQVCPP